MDAARTKEKLTNNAESIIYKKSKEFTKKGRKHIKVSPGSLATLLDIPYYKLQRHQVMRELSNRYDSISYMSHKGIELEIEDFLQEHSGGQNND